MYALKCLVHSTGEFATSHVHPWLKCSTCDAGKTSVHLAIGKNAGMITAWTSSQASNLSGLEGKGGCGTLCSVQRGSYTIVGVAWAMPPTQAQDTAAVLTASAQDGSLSSWRWDGQQVCESAIPLQCCIKLSQERFGKMLRHWLGMCS